jgi:methylmalonyl-CoA mutase N-terminal domain/subunit
MSDDKVFERYLEGERPADFETLSGFEIEPHYGPDGSVRDERPGEYPFTRGIHPEMYRQRLWTRRQQSGYGSPADSNARLIYLLRQGQTGLNVDFDVATKLGIDPDHPLGEGDVGLQGTSIATLEAMEALYAGIPLYNFSSTLIAHPPASAIIVALYVLAARRREIDPATLIGTIMNCAFTQLVGPTYQANTHFFPIDFSARVGLDVMEYCAREMPRWNIVNINAYNIRETGLDAVQEAAFALSVARHYLDGLTARGLAVDDFARRMAFFSAAHIDFFEEIAKLRAMRRIWARLLRETYGAESERACWFRTAIQTSALPLTAQEPLNNIVRASVQTLAAVLGGSQSIHTTSYDEAFALPSEESHRLSLRTQQVIAYETNVVKTADPLGGSYFVEQLTDRMEAAILELMAEIEERGGYLELFNEGWVESRIEEARIRFMDRIETGAQPVVGLNQFVAEDASPPEMQLFRIGRETIEARIGYIRDYRTRRDEGPLEGALAVVRTAAASEANVVPSVIDAVAAGATMGEICEAFRQAIGFSLAA